MSAKPIDAKVHATAPEIEWVEIGTCTGQDVADLYCDKCGWPLRWSSRTYRTNGGLYCTKGCATADLAQGVLQ